jgi:hypothetical protein
MNQPIRYLSVCSGIEAASVAWHPLGWEPVAFAEIDPFASAVLAHRFPNVRNLGDITKHASWNIEPGSVDVLVGGTPCQSFSVAGLRKGLADPRGNLALVYLAIIDQIRPRYTVWENVPGVLSSDGGRDFGSLLGGWQNSGMGSPTAFSTRSSCEWNRTLAPSLSDDGVCSLSDVLEPTGSVPPRYSLSKKACQGILRRAEKRGKALPQALHEALARIASAKE